MDISQLAPLLNDVTADAADLQVATTTLAGDQVKLTDLQAQVTTQTGIVTGDQAVCDKTLVALQTAVSNLAAAVGAPPAVVTPPGPEPQSVV